MSGFGVEKRCFTVALAVLISLVITGQLVVQMAWTADQANAGPTIAVLQLSNDKDTDWAVNDLLARLRSFVVDDLFIQDRIRVVKTSNPHIAESLDNNIVVYMSHGGPLGIVTGSRLTSWKTMLAMFVLLKFVWPGLLLPLMEAWTVLRYIFMYGIDFVDEWFPDIDIRTGLTSFVIWIVRFIVLIVCSWFMGYYFTLGVLWVGYGVLEN